MLFYNARRLGYSQAMPDDHPAFPPGRHDHAACVAGALAEFDGVRRYRLPMKDSPAARAIRVGRIRGERGDWH